MFQHISRYLLFFLLTLWINQYTNAVDKKKQMNIHRYCLGLFQKEALPTEYEAYCLLNKSPLNASVNYLAIPWSVLINYNQLKKVPKIKLKGGFTICQHVRYEKIIPLLKKIGIDTLFTPHAIKRKNYDGLTVLPFPHLAVNAPKPASCKDIWYSFIGIENHKTRSEIFKMPLLDDVVIKKRDKWHFFIQNEEEQKNYASEYQDILSRSRFSLCPRGAGASTIRFWESLRAGAIPVLIADDMSLPKWFDWSSCIIIIPEKNVEKINAILSNITTQQETLMRENCFHCFKQFSGKNFISVIRKHYEKYP